MLARALNGIDEASAKGVMRGCMVSWVAAGVAS
jgi:hypothetical protein